MTAPPLPIGACPSDFSAVNLNDLKISALSAADHQLVQHFLSSRLNIFAHSPGDLGPCTVATHPINTGEARPVAARPYRYSQADRTAIVEHVNQMLDLGIIEHSHSPWRSLPVMASKKDGGWRFCVNYRGVNNVTKKSSYPIPRIDDILDQLGGACVFSSLDARSGYWQIVMNPEDKEKTAFWSPNGLFQFLRMPFGLTAAPSTYQACMDRLLDGLPFATCYLDDVLVFSSSLEEHLKHLDAVFERLAQGNIRLHPSKCHFNCAELHHLGYIVNADGLSPDPAKVAAVADACIPANVTDVRSFLGLAGYYRKFVKGFSSIAGPLLALIRKDAPWEWTAACQDAFDELKSCLVRAPILAFPDFDHPFILATDWQPLAIGAVLSQRIGGEEKVIAYASRTLDETQQGWE